ncbi:MAG: L,D-transpeptidase [Pseudomonadota bacterium]
MRLSSSSLISRVSLPSLAGAVVIAAGLSVASASSASAQFLWGGGKNTVYDTQTVSFPQKYSPGQIIVSFGDRRLYHVFAKGRATSYPIAVPRERSRWQGVLRVSRKAENPTWTPTPLMRKENPNLPAFVKGGDKRNPLGVRALYLGSTMYRIHGTDAPHTIGKNVSKGCVRMHNKHVLALYDKIKVGTKVTATWSKYATKTTASTPTFAFASGNKARNVFNTQR